MMKTYIVGNVYTAMYTLPKGFFSCPHRRTIFGSRENPFWFQVEPSVERVLHETQKGSILEPKGFYLEPKIVVKRVLLWGQPKNPLRF